MPTPTPTAAAARLVCTILAGGAGTRFWPLSRRDTPKQLLTFFDDRTLLRATSERVAPLCPPPRQFVVTAARLTDAVQRELPDVPPAHVLAEPVPRNTLPCMALAAHAAQTVDPDAILCLLPADHWIADADAFRAALATAAAHADAGHLVTLGVQPTQPEMGYGWIERGGVVAPDVFAVERFVEKPDLARAVAYLQGGRHLWNAGVFVVRADRALAALARHQPAWSAALAPLRGLPPGSPAWLAVVELAYQTCPAISIDHGLAEHEADIAVVRLDAGWSDVGTWQSLLGLRAADAANVVRGEVVAIDCADSVLVSAGPLVAAVGLRGVAVVATRDAVLVLPVERSQDVRAVVDELVRRGRLDLT
ncbi:MAG: mannose-1-phosphate guanylyltransferase [Myxococcales bacterium]|nr:mannose-1-phosphate guanylyltransferase [Myxococcales bacterium]